VNGKAAPGGAAFLVCAKLTKNEDSAEDEGGILKALPSPKFYHNV
jgi:hypothetical protein